VCILVQKLPTLSVCEFIKLNTNEKPQILAIHNWWGIAVSAFTFLN
jgi:hypothetical protein